ncbi:MAG: hypothetical protein IPK50_05120 [Fibrobacterota bacterium]|nr:MAG: hypothetical protein IPK50_05120 [Fibrobacterota bacterium]
MTPSSPSLPARLACLACAALFVTGVFAPFDFSRTLWERVFHLNWLPSEYVVLFVLATLGMIGSLGAIFRHFLAIRILAAVVMVGHGLRLALILDGDWTFPSSPLLGAGQWLPFLASTLLLGVLAAGAPSRSGKVVWGIFCGLGIALPLAAEVRNQFRHPPGVAVVQRLGSGSAKILTTRIRWADAETTLVGQGYYHEDADPKNRTLVSLPLFTRKVQVHLSWSKGWDDSAHADLELPVSPDSWAVLDFSQVCAEHHPFQPLADSLKLVLEDSDSVWACIYHNPRSRQPVWKPVLPGERPWTGPVDTAGP